MDSFLLNYFMLGLGCPLNVVKTLEWSLVHQDIAFVWDYVLRVLETEFTTVDIVVNGEIKTDVYRKYKLREWYPQLRCSRANRTIVIGTIMQSHRFQMDIDREGEYHTWILMIADVYSIQRFVEKIKSLICEGEI